MRVAKPNYKVLYNGVNITADISRYMLSITYTDKVAGESDEVEIKLEDVDAQWQNSWYPEKGAKLNVTIENLKCGIFEIDEIELSGPPDEVSIRGMATGVTNSLRTKKSDAHENKTLKQIAEKVAQKNNLTIQGEVPDITIGRATQNKETDLAFLKRISKQYGVVFSVRDTVITFTSVYTLEGRKSSFYVDKSNLKSYTLKDKADGAIKAKSVHANPKQNEQIHQNKDFESWKNQQDYKAPDTASKDEKIDYSKTENTQQAEAKAKAIMHLSATNQFEGDISMEGNTLACAGNNFQLTGLGKLSGKYHIKVSKHTIDRSGGYSTDLEIKRLQTPTKSEQITHKKAKTPAVNVNVTKTNRSVQKEYAFNRNIIDDY